MPPAHLQSTCEGSWLTLRDAANLQPNSNGLKLNTPHPPSAPSPLCRGEKGARFLDCPSPAKRERYSVESQAAFDLFRRERVASAGPGSSCSRSSSALLRPFG